MDDVSQRLAVVESKLDDLRTSHASLIIRIEDVLNQYHILDKAVIRLDTRFKVMFGGSGVLGVAAMVVSLIW